MNLDELKDAWHNEPPQGGPLPSSTAILGRTSSAIVEFRKNMKREFLWSLVSYLMLVGFVFINPVHLSVHTLALVIILLFVMTMLSAFYFYRFYLMYRSMSKYDMNMRESIRKITYEMELNIAIYSTYNFCMTPLGLILAVLLMTGTILPDFLQILTSGARINIFSWIVSVVCVSVFTFGITYAFMEYHVHSSYGKYLAELKAIMNDLEKE